MSFTHRTPPAAPVNDAPARPGDRAFSVEAGAILTASLLPTGGALPSVGPPDEAGQTFVAVLVTPTADTHGTLQASGTDFSYTPDADFVGTASFSYQLRDSGGTANGGIDTSLPAKVVVTGAWVGACMGRSMYQRRHERCLPGGILPPQCQQCSLPAAPMASQDCAHPGFLLTPPSPLLPLPPPPPPTAQACQPCKN